MSSCNNGFSFICKSRCPQDYTVDLDTDVFSNEAVHTVLLIKIRMHLVCKDSHDYHTGPEHLFDRNEAKDEFATMDELMRILQPNAEHGDVVYFNWLGSYRYAGYFVAIRSVSNGNALEWHPLESKFNEYGTYPSSVTMDGEYAVDCDRCFGHWSVMFISDEGFSNLLWQKHESDKFYVATFVQQHSSGVEKTVYLCSKEIPQQNGVLCNIEDNAEMCMSCMDDKKKYPYGTVWVFYQN